jgi:predicted RNA binding protein YcfA (HicA-like mRNA interferase family)
MTKREKLLERIHQNPKNIRIEEMDALLLAWGFNKRTQGSHNTYTRGSYRITIPFRKPFLLPIYVQQVVKILDELGSSDD